MKVYAKIKGWQNERLLKNFMYWNYIRVDNHLVISSKRETRRSKTKYTKSEWAALGINSENADFEEIEDEER